MTTTRPDDKGEDEVIRELHIGANTDGVTNPNESPANDALRSLGNSVAADRTRGGTRHGEYEDGRVLGRKGNS